MSQSVLPSNTHIHTHTYTHTYLCMYFFLIFTKNGFIICRSLKITFLCMKFSLKLNWPVEINFSSCCGCSSLAQGRSGQTSAPNKPRT